MDDKDIHIEAHTILRANERGAGIEEIIDTLKTGISIEAKAGRQAKYKIFPFSAQRNKKFYDEKRVEVYYVTEGRQIFTVTVYVFYGNWSGNEVNIEEMPLI